MNRITVIALFGAAYIAASLLEDGGSANSGSGGLVAEVNELKAG